MKPPDIPGLRSVDGSGLARDDMNLVVDLPGSVSIAQCAEKIVALESASVKPPDIHGLRSVEDSELARDGINLVVDRPVSVNIAKCVEELLPWRMQA